MIGNIYPINEAVCNGCLLPKTVCKKCKGLYSIYYSDSPPILYIGRGGSIRNELHSFRTSGEMIK